MTDTLKDALALSHDPWPGERLKAIAQLSAFGSEPTVRARLAEMLDSDVVEVDVAAAEVLLKSCGVAGLELVLDELVRRVDDPQIDYIWYKVHEVKATTRPNLLWEAVQYAERRDYEAIKRVVAQLIMSFNRMQDIPHNRVNPDGTQRVRTREDPFS
jgi:hypothetical protein